MMAWLRTLARANHVIVRRLTSSAAKNPFMAEKVYLAVDLGAESGRVVAGMWNGNRIRLEEVFRFANGPVILGETIRWDVLRLWAEIQNGLALAGKKSGGKGGSIGGVTWS